MSGSTLTHLDCSVCGQRHDAERVQNLSTCCQRPLLARYDLARAARTLTRESLRTRRADLWRYAEVLPLRDATQRIALGEGWTPLVPLRLGARLGCPALTVKDEAQNPTGSFKARGIAVALSRARELGVTTVAIPTAGNAGGATAAYAAAAGMTAHVFMPRDAAPAFQVECRAHGARVELVDGLITDCGAKVREGAKALGWFDLSTLKEPYRLEGKKTLGYELAEQFDWSLPDVIVYPTGGGTGLVGMWKAFAELEALGLIGPARPRMVSVQATGCAPIVRAFETGAAEAEPWPDAHTIADGLRVPAAVGDRLILAALRESGGTALAVSDDAMHEYARVMASGAGLFPAPEGAACLAALVMLLESGRVARDERVVLFNTGSPFKYLR